MEIDVEEAEKTKRLHGFNFGLRGGLDEAWMMGGWFAGGLRLVYQEGDGGNDRIWRRFGSDDLGGCVAVFFCAYIDGR